MSLQALSELEVYAELLDIDAERTRYIRDGKLDLEEIANQADLHLNELRDKFHQLPNDTFNAVVKFITAVYLSYLDAEFVATQPEGGTVYSPDKLIDSARLLTLESANIGQVKEFYDAMEEGLGNSKRFMYKLVVEDLPDILAKSKSNEKYKDVFGYFATEVMREAAHLTDSGCRDKGFTFRKQYRELVQKYFPYINSDQKDGVQSATAALDIDILERYATMGLVNGVKSFQRNYGRVINVKWKSQPDGHNRQISFTFDPGNGPNSVYKSNANLEGVKVTPQVKDFLTGVTNVAAQYLRGSGQTGPELTETIACLRNVKRHL